MADVESAEKFLSGWWDTCDEEHARLFCAAITARDAAIREAARREALEEAASSCEITGRILSPLVAPESREVVSKLVAATVKMLRALAAAGRETP